MNILVIGGTGFIGPHVLRALMAACHLTTVYHRGHHETAPPGVRHILYPEASIPLRCFPPELFAAEPDVVIHMIPMGEPDARAAAEAFRGRTGRMVWLSSGDVYRAYGKLTRLEQGPVESGLLTEESPLRSVLYPYRQKAESPEAVEFNYEKILVEQTALARDSPASVVLRLPKVYGPGGNADLASVYRYRHHPRWRWTHGYVENVAAAIVLAALHPAASGRIYNVGEEHTPTIAARLAGLPPSELSPDLESAFNFAQDIAFDTTRIRRELGYREPIAYQEGLRRTFSSRAGSYS